MFPRFRHVSTQEFSEQLTVTRYFPPSHSATIILIKRTYVHMTRLSAWARQAILSCTWRETNDQEFLYVSYRFFSRFWSSLLPPHCLPPRINPFANELNQFLILSSFGGSIGIRLFQYILWLFAAGLLRSLSSSYRHGRHPAFHSVWYHLNEFTANSSRERERGSQTQKQQRSSIDRHRATINGWTQKWMHTTNTSFYWFFLLVVL